MKMYTINCTASDNSLNFYLNTESEELYLFTQRYSEAVYQYYRNPLSVRAALDHSRANNKKVHNVICRLNSYKKFVMVEYGISMLGDRKRRPYRRSKRYVYEYDAA